MIPLPATAKVWLACGATDMRKGLDGLAVLVPQSLKQSLHSGALFAFRGGAAIWSSCSGMTARGCRAQRQRLGKEIEFDFERSGTIWNQTSRKTPGGNIERDMPVLVDPRRLRETHFAYYLALQV